MELLEEKPIRRSISMPDKPRPIETKSLKRSEEKERVYEENYYPESPIYERVKRIVSIAGAAADDIDVDRIDFVTSEHEIATRNTASGRSKSAENFPCSHEWGDSSHDISKDPRRNELDPLNSRRRANRIVEKNGHENVVFRRIPEKSWRYIRDLVTTLIELDWKYMLTMFLCSYFFSWFFFAVLCYMVAYSHGDLIFDSVTGERLGEGQEPCIVGVYNFVSILIYSIETQTTIGFGEKYPSDDCPETIFLFIMQIICSIALEGGMVSIIYAKTARPAKQITKLKFSKKAVICYRDGKLCLIFRVCDPRETQTIESKIRVYMIVEKPTREGEVIKTYTELKLEGNGQQIIVWPETVCHVIDETSPLSCYTNAKEFNAAQFELYVSTVGISPTTAQVTEARTSYVPREIFWGQRFLNVISYDAINERYVVDYSNFNTTISVDMHAIETEQLRDECL